MKRIPAGSATDWLAGVALFAFSAAAQVPPDYPSGYQKIITSAVREGRVVIYSSTDLSAAAPLIAEFEAMYPSVKVEYSEMNTSESSGTRPIPNDFWIDPTKLGRVARNTCRRDFPLSSCGSADSCRQRR